ncbi:hypothetical protein KJ656_13995 [bacterium]|nr:hypothetical protein [bacterium]
MTFYFYSYGKNTSPSGAGRSSKIQIANQQSDLFGINLNFQNTNFLNQQVLTGMCVLVIKYCCFGNYFGFAG